MWLRGVLTGHPDPDKQLAGIWFGLANPIHDGRVVTDLHVLGADRFDPSGRTMEWALRPRWCPPTWAHSSILAQVHQIAYRAHGLGVDAEYPVALAYSCLAVCALLRNDSIRRPFPLAAPIGVAVGFDDGDWIVLGSADYDGLHLTCAGT
jgi:hypothetical protein